MAVGEVVHLVVGDRGEELRKAYRRARALNLQFETITFEKYAMQSAPAALTL